MGGGKIAYRNLLKTSILSLALVTSATSCSNEADEVNNSGAARLAINVALNQPASRAIITGNEMPGGSQIGIQLTGDGYDAYNNIKFTASGSVWAPVSDVLLTKNKGTLYAYYPYAESTDLSAIAVETESQTDYLYATPVANVNENNAEADLTMNHALTNIKLQFINNNYGAGAGNVSNITVSGDGFATTATFNAAQATPDYVANSFEPATGASISTDATVTLGHTDAIDFLVIPNGASKKLTITAEIDGQQYTATTGSDITLQKGKSYLYKLSLSSTYMAVDNSVTVTDWNKGNGESGEGLNLDKEVDKNIKVYAVSATNALIDYSTADNTAKGVAIVAGEHKFMIAKSDATDGTNTTLYWTKSYSDLSLTNYDNADGTNSYGYLGGSSTPQLSQDFTTWTAGALSDFNGKTNTEVIAASSSNAKDMCKVLETFNAGSDNQGHTDWYVPACGQLALMYLAKTDINAALAKIGGTALESYRYWSSSEYVSDSAWYVDFGNGTVGSRNKRDSHRVRFVRDI